MLVVARPFDIYYGETGGAGVSKMWEPIERHSVWWEIFEAER